MTWFIASLMIIGLWLILRPKTKSKASQPSGSKGKTSYQAKYAKLLSMVGGDKGVAHRLISAYGIDKAIYDLERDRQGN